MRYERAGKQRRRGRALPILLIVVVLVLGFGAGGVLAVVMNGGFGGAAAVAPSGTGSSLPATAGNSGTDEPDPAAEVTPNAYQAIAAPEEMRGIWFTFLEWQEVDFSSEAAARADIGARFDDCAALGLNTVICHVRPFGDSMYPSQYFPWSHLLTGTQGQSPGYDPLQVMIEEAHSRSLRFEALINPYRVKHYLHGPQQLSADNPASLNPAWVREYANGNVMYDPGVAGALDTILNGVAEIVQNYDVDGIQYDDYFYPEGIDESFDDASFAEADVTGLSLSAWRTENIDLLVQRTYQTVKQNNPTVNFGISPAGNNENNLNKYYADVNKWMANAGYVDYIMPQLYWGFGHVDGAGTDKAAFGNKVDEWDFYPRAAGVKLYAGLGAYRIGMLQEDGTRSEFGGNGSGDNTEWESGHAMADQVTHLRGENGFSGYALFRYDFLFQQGDTVSAAEREALAGL